MKKITAVGSALIALLGACSNPNTQPVEADPLVREALELHSFDPQSFAGRLEDGLTYVGILSLRGQVLAYVCDGSEGKVSVSQWFRGTLIGGKLEAASPDGSTLSAALGPNGLSGSVGKGASSRAFSAAEVSRPAGLWLGVGGLSEVADGAQPLEALHTVGWIVLPDGSQRGAADPSGGLLAASTLEPNTGINRNGSLAVNAEPFTSAGVRASLTYVNGRFISDQCGNYLAFEQHARRSGSGSSNRYWGIIGWGTQCFNQYGSMSAFL